MGKYIIKRLLFLIPILLIISLMVYFFMSLTGDPVLTVAGENATAEEVELMREAMGLNDPFFVRYGRYIWNVLHGDLGTSLTGKDVWSYFIERLPYTLLLAFAGMFVALIMSIPFGIIAAVKQNSWIDSLVSTVSIAGLSIPNFWLGLMLMLLFSVKLGWLPVSGATDGVRSLILPAICAGLSNAATLARMTRSSMVDALHAEYLQTARAKGVSEKKVVLKHAFRNALLPIITTAGNIFILLIGGTVVVETVFSWPGIGYVIVQSVRGNEYTLVTGFVILTTVLVALVLLAVDILYAYIDPRIKASYTGK